MIQPKSRKINAVLSSAVVGCGLAVLLGLTFNRSAKGVDTAVVKSEAANASKLEDPVMNTLIAGLEDQ